MPFFEMIYNNKNIWFVLFAPNGKVTKIRSYLEAGNIKYFYPMFYHEKRIKGSERKRLTLEPVLRNLLFVKSSKDYLDAFLKDVKLDLDIKSNLYYRDLGTKEIIVVPEKQMENFMAVAGCTQEHIIYLSNDEVNLKKGTKMRVIGGHFEGLEGIFMRIKGNTRVVVTLPHLFSVATAFIPTRFIVPLE